MNDDRPPDPPGDGESWFRTLFEHSPDAILLYDDEGTIADANPRATEYLGYSHEELVGMPIWEFTSGDPEAVTARWDAMDVGDTARFDAEHTTADGSTVPVRIHVSRVDLGEAVEFIGFVRVVTERHTREAELRAIRERTEFALDSTDSIVFEIDPETHHETRHGPFERIFGIPDSTVDTTERFYERAVHPDDRDAVATQQQALFDGEVESTTLEFRTNPEAGDARWIQSVMTRVGDDSSSIIGLSTDVTAAVERREALETLHVATRDLMAAESAEAIASIGSATATDVLELSINSVNRYDPETEALVPVAWSEENEALFGGQPPAIPAGEGLVWRALEAGESRVYRDVHEEADVLNESTPFRSEMHVPVGDDRVLLVSSESADAFEETDLALAQILAANMEAAFDRLAHEEELERQNQRLEEFASVVSHDLRNPLTVAVGRLELARETPEEQHLDAMARALDRMERIIENVLWLAREGQDVGPREPVDLAETVEACWRMVAGGIGGGGSSIEIEGDLGRIEADEDRLRQALENLLRNAVEHGGEDVSVTVGRLADGFFVEDDGPGIPEDRRETVFESGYSTTATGTGFGLRIVEQIVEAHGWSIRATEGADGGARFEVTGVRPLGS